MFIQFTGTYSVDVTEGKSRVKIHIIHSILTFKVLDNKIPSTKSFEFKIYSPYLDLTKE